MGHISSHANAQLMRIDPDRVTIGPDQISRNLPDIIDRNVDTHIYKWPLIDGIWGGIVLCKRFPLFSSYRNFISVGFRP